MRNDEGPMSVGISAPARDRPTPYAGPNSTCSRCSRPATLPMCYLVELITREALMRAN